MERARRGDGPTLIECETYRFRGHSLADPDELRSKEEKEHYLVRACFVLADVCGGVWGGGAFCCCIVSLCLFGATLLANVDELRF